jgi:SAM-dependent methyltransferase
MTSCRLHPRHSASLLLATCIFLVPARSNPQTPPFSDRISPYVSTPPRVVERMLELAEVTDADTVYDLGSGDGRIVITAAQKFGARAVGVEIRSELAAKSSREIERVGLEKLARIIHGDMFDVNPSRATVVTLYQLTSVNRRLRGHLEKTLRPGTRIVSVDFQIPGWTPAKTATARSEAGTEYSLFLYLRE